MLTHKCDVFFQRACCFEYEADDTVDNSNHCASYNGKIESILVEPKPFLAWWILTIFKHPFFPAYSIELNLRALDSAICVIVCKAEAVHESLSLLGWLLVIFVNKLQL